MNVNNVKDKKDMIRIDVLRNSERPGHLPKKPKIKLANTMFYTELH